ncbi:MAG: hypothetical protein IT530_11165 [Burkholderiales bacterium]|nr:hypothetical protein [Burkholderiales bacterium]
MRGFGGLVAAAAMAVAATGVAHESRSQVAAFPLHAVEPAEAAYTGAGSAGQATVDPLVRALVIGIAASILREAAAQPDPVEGLGNAIERRVAAALADPNTMRLVQSALREALRDAPPELREPLTLFAAGVLQNMRRDMSRDLRPRQRF